MKYAFFIPTVQEFTKIFPDLKLSLWKYQIQKSTFKRHQIFITGIGKANTAFSVGIILNDFNSFIPVMLGIAGAYKNSNLNPGDLVCVKKDFFVDEGYLKNEQLILTSEMNFPICNKNYVEFKPFEGIQAVNANTVSLLSADEKLEKIYSGKTGAEIETMEGAAFGLAASKLGKTALQIRVISNYCGNRNEQAWDMKTAFKTIRTFVENTF